MLAEIDSLQMKNWLRPLLLALACGSVTFLSNGRATFRLLLHYKGFDHVPTDPDYDYAIAMGSWGCFVYAVICGVTVGLATVALSTRYLYRRTLSRRAESFLPH